MQDVISFRHELHRFPDLSGHEAETARRVERFIRQCSPDEVVSELGGHGVAFSFDAPSPGPEILLRCELDALPIDERSGASYASTRPGISHQCGHDGHMAVLAAVAQGLAKKRPRIGRVILLFQPAEETGEGAARVLADPRFSHRHPDQVYALHNLPGWPLGQVILRQGSFNCASVGLAATLTGSSSHAAHPEQAVSPTRALAGLLDQLPRLPAKLGLEGALVTITHTQLGEPTLGITPGHARLLATLRAPSDEALERLLSAARDQLQTAAAEGELRLTAEKREPFRALVNHDQACHRIRSAARGLGLTTQTAASPLPWSEDFSELTHRFEGALFGLGAGTDCPPLHSPDYDFPDPLIELGARLFRRLIDDQLG